ncbi:MAG: hypothetical protein ACRD7E_09695, partial [Bryobacteraceae bacterium]
YTSIGCAPCTRATSLGEDERAGRWWWEEDADKECGIHFNPDGTAERTVDVLIREILEPQTCIKDSHFGSQAFPAPVRALSPRGC